MQWSLSSALPSNSLKRKREDSEPEYEDTLPEEYAGPVYRGSFWLISDEFKPKKRLKPTPSSELKPDLPEWGDDFPAQIPPPPVSPIPKPLPVPIPDAKIPNFVQLHPFVAQGKRQYSNRLTSEDPKGPLKQNNLKKLIQRKAKKKPAVPSFDRRANHNLGDGSLVALYCNHCNRTFKAKPTYRPKFMHHLVNHACSGLKRHQFVLGVKHRKCQFQCDSTHGCIYLISS